MTGRVIDFWHRVTTIANAFGVHIDGLAAQEADLAHIEDAADILADRH